jgi:hypothetical protein
MESPRPPNLGPTCVACGYPWRPGRTTCARCGFDPAAPGKHQWGLLTVFGCGLCGLLAGGEIGFAGAVAATTGPGLQRVASLAVLGGAVLGCLVAAAVRRRLVPAVHCAYEHLLLGCAGGGFVLAVAALAGVTQFEALILIWTTSSALAFWALRRYGYQAGGAHSRSSSVHGGHHEHR